MRRLYGIKLDLSCHVMSNLNYDFAFPEHYQGRNKARQTVRSQSLGPNCGTSFQFLFKTAAALMFLNLDLKHFYLRNFFIEHLLILL